MCILLCNSTELSIDCMRPFRRFFALLDQDKFNVTEINQWTIMKQIISAYMLFWPIQVGHVKCHFQNRYTFFYQSINTYLFTTWPSYWIHLLRSFQWFVLMLNFFIGLSIKPIYCIEQELNRFRINAIVLKASHFNPLSPTSFRGLSILKHVRLPFQ